MCALVTLKLSVFRLFWSWFSILLGKMFCIFFLNLGSGLRSVLLWDYFFFLFLFLVWLLIFHSPPNFVPMMSITADFWTRSKSELFSELRLLCHTNEDCSRIGLMLVIYMRFKYLYSFVNLAVKVWLPKVEKRRSKKGGFTQGKINQGNINQGKVS